MISLYVGSTVGYSGKSMVCLGIGTRLAKDGFRYGYMKPIGRALLRIGDLVTDEEAVTIEKALSLNEPLEAICPVVITHDLVIQAYQNEIHGLEEKILQAHRRLSEGRDLMLIGGARNLSEGAFLDLSTLYVIKKILNAKVVLINQYSNDICVDCILGAYEALGERLIGVILNQVAPERIDYIKRRVVPFLMHKGIDVLGIIPHDYLLNTITVRELSQILDAKILCGEECLEELVESFSIGAMSVNKALKYFRQKKNKAVITGGDRPDIQLAALETSTKCIILTGNLYPNDLILAKAEEQNVPMMVVRDDTLTAVEKTEGIFNRLRVKDKRKINRAIELVDQYLDFPILYKKLGLR